MRSATKYNLIYFILSLFLLLFFSSCKKADWYDVKTDASLAVPSTLTDFQAIMDKAELFSVNTPALGEAGSDGHYISDATFQATVPMSKNAYTWSHNQPYTQLFDWNGGGQHGAFVKIYYCNIVLEGLSKFVAANSLEEDQMNNIKGQALFYRAKCFFEIAEVFAPAYNATTSITDLGVPLRLEPDPLLPSARSTVKQTYDQIIEDLTKAKDLLSPSNLPTTILLKCRPTHTAALALLARVNLSKEDYLKAGEYASQALNLYNVLLNYKNISTTTLQRFDAEVILHSVMSTQLTPARATGVLIDTNWYNLYDADDRRKTLFFARNATTKLVTYRGGYAGANTVFSGLAVDELYLIRAECFARAGNKDAAINDLNTLLEKRWVAGIPYPQLSATDAEDALRKVLLERKKELILRGLRWSDLRRLNKDERFKITITRVTPAGTFTLEPNSYKYTYPIPDDIIQISGMQQNVGW